MSKQSVEYDGLAESYDERFRVRSLEGVVQTLHKLMWTFRPLKILEVGCGTGWWLEALAGEGRPLFGVDISREMLRIAARRGLSADFVQARASRLPFPVDAFDFVLCVNALHHFRNPLEFTTEARRLIGQQGALVIVWMNPHRGINWYLYDYFAGTYQADLERYPRESALLDWLIEAGFGQVEWQESETLIRRLEGREVLLDPFLKKGATSQLTVLTDEDYAAGLARIRAAIDQAESLGDRLIFPVEIPFSLVVAQTGADR
jgi:ubiquinone/menaquinone biosynthesis C-methylase UbiE